MLGVHGVLRLSGISPLRVPHVADFLASVSEAYEALDAFDRAIRAVSSIEPIPVFPYEAEERIAGRMVVRIDTRRLWPPPEPLQMSRVVLESPGFWEFVGSLNPLEQIRIYLQERHERRKDKDYRNDAEARRLHAEARITELQAERLSIRVEAEKLDLLNRGYLIGKAGERAAGALAELAAHAEVAGALDAPPELDDGSA